MVILKKIIDMTGKRFSRLLVLRQADRKNGKVHWLCKCDCGKETIVHGTKLRNGHTKSCGCLQKDTISEIRKTHGHSRTPLYVRWTGIKQRCLNENHTSYNRYGGKGIHICEQWLDYEVFKEWAERNNYKPELELDRIDNSKGYNPENCRWVSKKMNSQNRDSKVMLSENTLTVTIKRLAKENSLTYTCLMSRYYRLKEKGLEQTIDNILNYTEI